MPIEARKLYLKAIIERYKNATRKQKSVILTEFCQVCGYNRKYAISILKSPLALEKRQRRPGRKPIYNEVFAKTLVEVWELTGRICSKKLKAAIPVWLKFLNLTDPMSKLMLKVSSTTIDRLLRPFRTPRGLSSTKPSMFRHRIPIALISGYVTDPGHLEADTVAHCGSSLFGDFVNTLTVTDLATGWTENRATWGKSAPAIVAALKHIESELPFHIKSFASDNGSEFLNAQMQRYLTEREKKVHWTRRRPYKKNDAAHVEQKNWTHVRELFGYDRFENIFLRQKMDEIYFEFWNPLQNFFIPVFKLYSKERVGGRIKKIYDEPQSPYQRLLKSGHLTKYQEVQIKTKFSALNPVELRKKLDQKLKEFWEIAEKSRVRSTSPQRPPQS